MNYRSHKALRASSRAPLLLPAASCLAELGAGEQTDERSRVPCSECAPAEKERVSSLVLLHAPCRLDSSNAPPERLDEGNRNSRCQTCRWMQVCADAPLSPPVSASFVPPHLQRSCAAGGCCSPRRAGVWGGEGGTSLTERLWVRQPHRWVRGDGRTGTCCLSVRRAVPHSYEAGR